MNVLMQACLNKIVDCQLCVTMFWHYSWWIQVQSLSSSITLWTCQFTRRDEVVKCMTK